MLVTIDDFLNLSGDERVIHRNGEARVHPVAHWFIRNARGERPKPSRRLWRCANKPNTLIRVDCTLGDREFDHHIAVFAFAARIDEARCMLRIDTPAILSRGRKACAWELFDALRPWIIAVNTHDAFALVITHRG